MVTRATHRIQLVGALTSLFLMAATITAASPPFRVDVSGRGPAMLLIPGLNSSGEVWTGVVDHFKDRYTCHVLTLAGFAGEPPPAAPSLTAVRDAIVSYIDSHQLDRPVLVGHSLGAFLAFWVASTAPDKVGPLVAIDGVPFLPALMNPSATIDSVRPQAELMRKSIEHAPNEQRAQMSLLSLGSMISDTAQVERARRWADASDPRTSAAFVLELMTTDLRSDVSRIKTPVLLVAAGAPFGTNTAALARLEQAYERQVVSVARHRTVVAQHARHFVMLDDPAFLHVTMEEFLGR
jgi:N-formylmaleamate deformylase